MIFSFKNHPDSSRGTSLIEIVIIVVIFLILLAMITTSYVKFLNYQRLVEAVEGTVSIIEKARNLTLASKNGLAYSIHIDDEGGVAPAQNRIVLYTGTYGSGETVVETFAIPGAVKILAFATPNPGFKRQSGGACVNDASSKRELYVERITGNMKVSYSGGTDMLCASTAPCTNAVGNCVVFQLKNGSSDQKFVRVLPLGVIQVQ